MLRSQASNARVGRPSCQRRTTEFQIIIQGRVLAVILFVEIRTENPEFGVIRYLAHVGTIALL